MEEIVVYEIQTDTAYENETEEENSSNNIEINISDSYDKDKEENEEEHYLNDYEPSIKILRIEEFKQNDNNSTEIIVEYNDQAEEINLHHEEENIYKNDINSRLKLWALQSEISIPKLNSLLRILNQYHPSLPYNATNLLGEDNCLKLRSQCQQVKVLSAKSNSNTAISDIVKTKLSKLEEEVLEHLNLKIGKLKRFVDSEMNTNVSEKEHDQDESTSERFKYQELFNNFPIKNIEEVDKIEIEIKENRNYREQFIKTLELIKGNDKVSKFFRNIFSDEVLSKFTLNKYSTDKKIITDYNLFLVIIYQVLCDSDQSLNDYIKIIKLELKKAKDRIGANLRFNKKK